MSVTDWKDLFPHTVTVASVLSRDKYGGPTYGSGIDYSARVLYKNVRTTDARGVEVLAKGVVWIQGTPSIGLDDKITLPDGTTPPILNVQMVPDERGTHHVKVYFG